jgi:transposase InsO family protein
MIVEVSVDGLNVREFCAAHGVSTWFFYDLRRRYRLEGEAVLAVGSRAAKRVANRTPPDVEELIVALRKQLGEEGLDSGPATIRHHLGLALAERGDGRSPSEATIWRVLGRRGFITAQPEKAPKCAHRRFVAGRANECWQVDDTGWELDDGREVKIINILDDCSRVAVASVAMRTVNSERALEAILAGAARWALPERMLADNGPPYRDTLAAGLAQLGVAFGHSRLYHPQTCGKVERFHQTLKQFLAAHDPPANLAHLQALIDRFVALYNHQRPHRGIGRAIPAQVWTDTPKSGPANHRLDTPTRIYHGTVTKTGVIEVGKHHHQPGQDRRPSMIQLGSAHRGKPATVVITGTACHVFSGGHLIRRLTLDPTRRYQRLLPSTPTVRDAPRHA